MRNLDTAYRPVGRTAQVTGLADVFRGEAGPDAEWVKTSINLRPAMRVRLKQYAAAHDLKLQDVIDAALDAYLR